MDSLQEVVGEPLSEERKMVLMPDNGDKKDAMVEMDGGRTHPRR